MCPSRTGREAEPRAARGADYGPELWNRHRCAWLLSAGRGRGAAQEACALADGAEEWVERGPRHPGGVPSPPRASASRSLPAQGAARSCEALERASHPQQVLAAIGSSCFHANVFVPHTADGRKAPPGARRFSAFASTKPERLNRAGNKKTPARQKPAGVPHQVPFRDCSSGIGGGKRARSGRPSLCVARGSARLASVSPPAVGY